MPWRKVSISGKHLDRMDRVIFSCGDHVWRDLRDIYTSPTLSGGSLCPWYVRSYCLWLSYLTHTCIILDKMHISSITLLYFSASQLLTTWSTSSTCLSILSPNLDTTYQFPANGLAVGCGHWLGKSGHNISISGEHLERIGVLLSVGTVWYVVYPFISFYSLISLL